MIEAYLIALVGVMTAQASPGPNLMAVASTGFGQGRRAALLVTLGLANGMLIWAVTVSYGLGTLFTRYPSSLIALKLAGGSYLLYLAIRALKSGFTNSITPVQSDQRVLTDRDHWRGGLLVVLTNPKAALMWSAVAVLLFGSHLDTWQVALFGLVGATSGLMIYGAYAVLFSTDTALHVYTRYSRWLESAFCASFAVLGGKLLIDAAGALR